MAKLVLFFLWPIACSTIPSPADKLPHEFRYSRFETMKIDYEYILNTLSNGTCPCLNVSLCDNIQEIYNKELFGFSQAFHIDSISLSNISLYNWTYLTTLVTATNIDPQFMCYAHSQGVRLIVQLYGSNFPMTSNKTARSIWIQKQFEAVSNIHFDGLNFDWEYGLDSAQRMEYLDLLNETTTYFHANMPGSQISVDVSWEPYTYCNRYYGYYNISLAVDLLYIMGYDTNWNFFQSQCIAMANAPYQGMQYGLTGFINYFNIDPYKLIYGIPFFEYSYQCNMDLMESPKSKYCPIYFHQWSGFSCSQAGQTQISFATMWELIDNGANITEFKHDPNTQTPFFNYYDGNNKSQVLQIWGDDVSSLRNKYHYAKTQRIRGVGPWVFLDIYNNFNQKEMKRAQEMWSAFDEFFV